MKITDNVIEQDYIDGLTCREAGRLRNVSYQLIHKRRLNLGLKYLCVMENCNNCVQGNSQYCRKHVILFDSLMFVQNIDLELQRFDRELQRLQARIHNNLRETP